MLAVWNFIKPHLAYWIIGAIALFAFNSWLREHDARLAADQQVKQSETVVSDLKAQIAARATETAAAKQVIIREVHDAVTPEQQIALIPKLTEIPLEPVKLSDRTVQVDTQPLIQQLAKCNEDAIELGACRQDTLNLDSIVFEKQNEIKALQKKPGFWHRVGSAAKKVAIGAGLVLVERGIH